MSVNYLDLWLKAAHEHQRVKGAIPLVIGVELYEYLGQTVTVVSANVYRAGASCTIETRSADRATVELEELSLRQERRA